MKYLLDSQEEFQQNKNVSLNSIMQEIFGTNKHFPELMEIIKCAIDRCDYYSHNTIGDEILIILFSKDWIRKSKLDPDNPKTMNDKLKDLFADRGAIMNIVIPEEDNRKYPNIVEFLAILFNSISQLMDVSIEACFMSDPDVINTVNEHYVKWKDFIPMEIKLIT